MPMTSSPSKINLIYVASIGRSGTTLFESMLGAHSQMDTLGELHLWPHEIRMGGVQQCGTGYYVQDCPFWTEMRRRVQPLAQPDPRIDAFRENHDGGRTLRLSRLKDFSPEPLSSEVEAKIYQYGLNNYKVFSTFKDLVEEKTGDRPKWVVDASKDPYRLLWLLRSGLFNMKVFHMVKHPCGFAYSATKGWIQNPTLRDHYLRCYWGARQSLAWVVQNELFRRIAANFLDDDSHRLLKYEQFASNPHEIFQEVCSLIGVDYEEWAVDNWRSGSRFTLAGNSMRYEDRPIELDDEWKRKLPGLIRLITHLVTGPARSRYGY